MSYPPGPGSAQPAGAPDGSRPVDPAASGDDRTLAIVAHLSAIIALVVSASFLTIVGPLVIWLFFRERSALVRNAAASAFNFAITVWVATIVGWILVFTILLLPLGIVLIVGAAIAQIVFSIIGAVRASRGEIYRYPWQIPLLN